jgi:hypothetical protein
MPVNSTLSRSSVPVSRPLNYLTTKLRDLAERILLGHAGPLEPEDEVIHSERAGVPLDVVPAFLRIAEDEPVAREILEWHREALLLGIGLSRPQSAYARYFGSR